MSDYHTFTWTRQSISTLALNTLLRQSDPTAAVIQFLDGTVVLKKETTWTAGQITLTQTILNGAAELTAAQSAQIVVDKWPIELIALVLALIDQINVIRSKLVPPLAAITPAQALAAVRTKAGTL